MAMPGCAERDRIQAAVFQAVQPIAHMEKQWDAWKLETRISAYFRAGTKNLQFDKNKPWDELVYAYCDSVFNSIFQALSDREWLNLADFLAPLRASILELFPPNVLCEVAPQDFEQTSLCAHDQAFEEQRFAVILHESLSSQVKDKRTRNRIYQSVEAGRRSAAQMNLSESANPAEEFATSWVNFSIERLRAECNGWPEQLMQPAAAIWLFHTLIDQGAFPVSLLASTGPIPSGWPVITQAVQAAYATKGKGKGKAATTGDSKILTLYTAAGNPSYTMYGSRGIVGAASPGANMKAAGHPLCTQGEDCIGNAEATLFQHMETETIPGDLYCTSCWMAFSMADPTLKGEVFKM